MEPSQAESGRFTKQDWGLLLLLAAIQFTHMVDFVIIMPLGDRIMAELSINPQQFGFIVAAYGIAAALASLLGSLVVDRFDRKYVLVTVYAGFTLSTLLCGMADTFEHVLMARALAGMFGGLAASTIMAIIGDLIPPRRRGRAAGIVMSAFAVASIAGLPAGLSLAVWQGRGAPFIALAGLSLAVLIMVLFRLPAVRGHLATERKNPFVEFAGIVATPNYWTAFLFTFTMVLGTFTMIPFIGPYMTSNVGRAQGDLPIIYFFAGLCTLISMNVLGRVADGVNRKNMYLVMAGLTIVVTLIVSNLTPIPLWQVVLLISAFMVCASGRMIPAQALIIGVPEPRNRGAFMSLNTAVQHMGSGVAPIIGGAFMIKNEAGLMVGYPKVGLIAASLALVSIVLARFLVPYRVATIDPTLPIQTSETKSIVEKEAITAV